MKDIFCSSVHSFRLIANVLVFHKHCNKSICYYHHCYYFYVIITFYYRRYVVRFQMHGALQAILVYLLALLQRHSLGSVVFLKSVAILRAVWFRHSVNLSRQRHEVIAAHLTVGRQCVRSIPRATTVHF